MREDIIKFLPVIIIYFICCSYILFIFINFLKTVKQKSILDYTLAIFISLIPGVNVGFAIVCVLESIRQQNLK